MSLADQLYSAGIGVFPCQANKAPAVNRGTHWAEYAKQDPAVWNWPTNLVGVPIPPGALVIDLDTYKGVTRAEVERVLGCSLPWDSALIQYTQRGGQHYAFSTQADIIQDSNLLGVRGFDTRVAEKGYICTGAPDYTPVGFGVFALSQPRVLPVLPQPACLALAPVERPDVPPTELPHGDRDAQTIVEALRHVDPGCGRSEWVKVGLALRHHFHDDEAAGLTLFHQWSAGEFWQGDAPANYVPEHIEGQWGSFKPEGNTTIGSLFYEAIQGGWRPPAGVDTSAAFGEGAAASDLFNQIVDSIHESGSDPKHTGDIIESIQALGGNSLQVATLLALITRELKDAGLLTKPIRERLDLLAGGSSPPKMRGEYGKNHTENAGLYIERNHAQAPLARSDQVWYAYTGKAWAERDDDDVRHSLAADMAGSLPQNSNITGTYSVMCALCHKSGVRINEIPPQCVLYQNGVLDLGSGQLYGHTPDNFTTNILPYNYTPHATAPRWRQFLREIFEGDEERIALLQEWFGYNLSNSYAHHKILFMLGPPRCGKGTIGRMLEKVVGTQNFTGMSLHAFNSDAFLESLRTKTVAFSGDTERRVNRASVDSVIERIKKISGNDAVTFSRKYKSTLSQTLPTRMTFAANQVPALFDDSGALASRMLVLPFNVSFAGREDLHLFSALCEEVEGVAFWALQGLARLTDNGAFTNPLASQAEAQFIAEAYSPLKVFIDGCCQLDTNESTSCIDLYNAYKAWAVTSQEDRIMPRRTFISVFKDATRGRGCRYGPQRIGNKTERGFRGVTVRQSDSLLASAFQPEVVKK